MSGMVFRERIQRRGKGRMDSLEKMTSIRRQACGLHHHSRGEIWEDERYHDEKLSSDDIYETDVLEMEAL